MFTFSPKVYIQSLLPQAAKEVTSLIIPTLSDPLG